MTKLSVNHGNYDDMTIFSETFLKMKMQSKGFNFSCHIRHVIMRYRMI